MPRLPSTIWPQGMAALSRGPIDWSSDADRVAVALVAALFIWLAAAAVIASSVGCSIAAVWLGVALLNAVRHLPVPK